MRAHGFRLPLAMVWASAAAGVATALLRPRSGVIEPAPVEPREYFSAEEIERARAYQRPQRALALAGMALEGIVLALVARRPPRALTRAGAAGVGAGLSAGLTVLGLPLSALRHRRAVAAGISVQSWRSWLVDAAKAGAIGAGLNAGVLTAAAALMRRFPGRWWAPAAGGATALGAGFVLLSPVALDPVFNKFEPLPDGELRRDVLALAERAGVNVGEVYRMDASRRTTAANAYVTGLGRTKRVVLYDTLLRDFSPGEVRSVVAHELSHVRHRDVPRALAWFAIAAPAGMHLVERLTERMVPEQDDAAALPALALAAGVISFAGTISGAALSRRVEARADAFALELTSDPRSFIDLERRLALKALAEPQPPRLLQTLFGTHPSTVQRIGFGLAFERASA